MVASGALLMLHIVQRGYSLPFRSVSSDRNINLAFMAFNTLWTGDADLRLYITTVQDG